MAESTHQVLVYSLPALTPHDNADALALVNIDNYQVVVNKNMWREGDLCAYLQPDSLVDTKREEFKFLDKKGIGGEVRIKAAKLRGKVSFGLLVPAPAGSKVGDDVREILGVKHYEPPLEFSTGGDNVPAPRDIYAQNIRKYDIEGLRRYLTSFNEGELVYITEKIHGASGKNTFRNDTMYVGSRTNWKKDDPKCLWWIAYRNTPSIESFCKENEHFVLFGEVYGNVQNLKYGVDKQECARFIAFDIQRPTGEFLDVNDFIAMTDRYNIPRVPIIKINHPFNFEEIKELAEQDSLLCPGQLMEGVVIKPMKERWDENCGRLALKLISERYSLV